MDILDVFNGDAFSMVSLTDSMEVLPYQPKRLGELGIFRDDPIDTLVAGIEERDGQLSLVPFAARGTAGTTPQRKKRRIRYFEVPHLPHGDVLTADELIGKRAFGQQTQQELFANALNDKLEQLRRNFETTFEWHRMSALKGQLLDADGSVYYDFFDEFGLTEEVFDFVFSVATTDIKGKCTEILRAIEDDLGNDTMTGVHCFCGAAFFDALVTHPKIEAAYERYLDNEFARTTQFRKTFKYGGIVFEEYRGKVGTQDFIATNQARFFPTGTTQLFTRKLSPANFIETVGTKGRLIYVKQTRQKNDTGIDIHTQSNPLTMCRRPRVLKKGTMS